MSNEIGVNHYNGSYIQKGIEVKEPRPLSELSIFDLNRIEKALEENLEKGNISQEVFQRELEKLDIVKAGKLSQNGKLKPVHIIDKNGHHRVVWKLPEEISGMKNEGHKKVRQVGKGDKVTYNGETHEVHSISDKHGYWTLIGPDGKKHDKSPARFEAIHAPKDEEESKDKEPKKEETTQNYKVGQKVNIDDFGVNREYTIKKISPNGEMSLEAPGTATFTADKKWLDENKIEPKKEAPKSDANPKEDNSFSEDPIAALKNTPATSGKSGTKEPKRELPKENDEPGENFTIKNNTGIGKEELHGVVSRAKDYKDPYDSEYGDGNWKKTDGTRYVKEGLFTLSDSNFDIKYNFDVSFKNTAVWNPRHYATIDAIRKNPRSHTVYAGAGQTPDETINNYKIGIEKNNKELLRLREGLKKCKEVAQDIQSQLPKLKKGELFVATDTGGHVYISDDKEKLENSLYLVSANTGKKAKLKVFDASSPSVGKHDLGLPMVKGLESFLKNRPDKK